MTGDSPPETGYFLDGTVVEVAPDARRQAPGHGGPESVVAAWRIRRGRINGVDVSRQVVLVVTTCPPWGPDKPVARLILLDERATPEQVLVLLDTFRGRLGGGPFVDPGPPVADGFSQVPITYRPDHDGGVVSIPRRFRLVFRLDPGGHVHASEIWINLTEHGLVWSATDVHAAHREFHLGQDQSQRASSRSVPMSNRPRSVRRRW